MSVPSGHNALLRLPYLPYISPISPVQDLVRALGHNALLVEHGPHARLGLLEHVDELLVTVRVRVRVRVRRQVFACSF